ncbi:uncharacterized protein LOC142342582 [Convolutriloba macropyga]|uniref:uncharacterized protein LOC142342582 n=1 Tax=Convolutriloba macropyga TaxID=536237 RepID=UPI003F527242
MVDEIKEDLRRVQKLMNNEREFREAIDWLCDKYSWTPVADARDLMLDVERDHQLFLFQQAYMMNRHMSAHMSKERTNFRDTCRDLIRQNYELLEERNKEVETMEKHIKNLHDDNMKLKSSLVDSQRMVREMVHDLNSLDPFLHWEPLQNRRKSY